MHTLFGILTIALSIFMPPLVIASPLPPGVTTLVRLPLGGVLASTLGNAWLPLTTGSSCGSMMSEYPAWLPSKTDRPSARISNSGGIVSFTLTWQDGNSLEFGSGAGALSRQGVVNRKATRWDDFSLRIFIDEKRLTHEQSKWKAHQCGYFVRGTFERSILQHVLDTFGSADDPIFGHVFFATPNIALMQTYDGMVWRSPDGGASWEAVVNLHGEPAMRWFERFNGGGLETRDGDGDIVRSTDSGASWSALRTSDLAYDLGYGEMTRPRIVGGVGYALSVREYGLNPTKRELSLVRSDSYGLHWRRFASAPSEIAIDPDGAAPGLFVVDRNLMIVVWSQSCESRARLWSTANGGNSWHELASPGVGRLAIDAVNRRGLDIQAYDRCATAGGFLESSNGGRSWNHRKLLDAVRDVAGQRVTLDDVSMADESLGGATAGSGHRGLALITADRGWSWHDVTPSGFNGTIVHVSCEPKPRRCIFTGLSDTIIIWQARR